MQPTQLLWLLNSHNMLLWHSNSLCVAATQPLCGFHTEAACVAATQPLCGCHTASLWLPHRGHVQGTGMGTGRARAVRGKSGGTAGPDSHARTPKIATPRCGGTMVNCASRTPAAQRGPIGPRAPWGPRGPQEAGRKPVVGASPISVGANPISVGATPIPEGANPDLEGANPKVEKD